MLASNDFIFPEQVRAFRNFRFQTVSGVFVDRIAYEKKGKIVTLKILFLEILNIFIRFDFRQTPHRLKR
ncbi:hypothetical protein CH370_14700 [Leptospira kmetyi]|nr:hypothetical protein LEP1GSC052_2640 [Leptospira kmetyi serovar Malaysia str. Bejo-Iso9]PJZ40574.1 hypothetical protein CH370_14700 [Leptospira kmetyi]